MENTYNVFLKQKYQFQAQRGDIIVREGEKNLRLIGIASILRKAFQMR